jgi:hypothetical protein
VLQDVYFSIGHLFQGAVVDGNLKFVSHDWKPDKGEAVPLGQVFWGNDMLSVDRRACEVGHEATPDYVSEIERLRKLQIEHPAL